MGASALTSEGRLHRMPFGVQPRANGVSFRLWAPGARRVDLMLYAKPAPRAIAMLPERGGWFEVFVATASATTRYAFRIDDGPIVPDPASRFNPDDVHCSSLVTDPQAFRWRDRNWRGRSWEEAVIYELHVGTFSQAGTFAAAATKLDALVDLGVTAIELMPVADFSGKRGWGYDGVLLFAPHARYGSPDDLKRLVQAAHGRGLMVLLDVVYNHLGPAGNQLPLYAPQFFNPAHQTPWGAAINFDGRGARTVRDFFVHNALYWIEEFHLDGLRLDAVEEINDASRPDIIEEIAYAIAAGPGRERRIHLILECNRNAERYLQRDGSGSPRCAIAQWNDAFHRAAHVLATGETGGYYGNYAAHPHEHFVRALADGCASTRRLSRQRADRSIGEPETHLPPSAFVTFLQSHDEVGNRVCGERLTQLAPPHRLRALIACWLLAPSTPMLWMGEEWGATSPFLYFYDFDPELAAAVAEARRVEFGRCPRSAEPASNMHIADPNDPVAFKACKLDWSEVERAPHAQWLALYRELLALRRKWIVPRLKGMRSGGRGEARNRDRVRVEWTLGDSSRLILDAHLPANAEATARGLPAPCGQIFYETKSDSPPICGAWTVRWCLESAPG
jgi:malto-oligosyltrehalose trehalohydrolase